MAAPTPRRVLLAPTLLLVLGGTAWGETVMERDARLAIERERYAPNVHNPGFTPIEGPGTRWAREQAEADEAVRQAAEAEAEEARRNAPTETDRLRWAREEREEAEINAVLQRAARNSYEAELTKARNREVGHFRHLNLNLQHLTPGQPVPILISGEDLAKMAAFYEADDAVIDEDPVIAQATDRPAARRLRAEQYLQFAASVLHPESLTRLVRAEARRIAEEPVPAVDTAGGSATDSATVSAAVAANTDRRQLIGLVDCWLAATGLAQASGPVAELKPGATPAAEWSGRIARLDPALGHFTRAIAEDLDDGAVASAATQHLLQASAADGGPLSPVAAARAFTRFKDQANWQNTRLDDEYAELIAKEQNNHGPEAEWIPARKIAYAYERDAMGSVDKELAAMKPGPEREATRLARAVRWYGVSADGWDPLATILISQLVTDLRHPPEQRIHLGRWLVARATDAGGGRSLADELQARIARNEVPAQVAAGLLFIAASTHNIPEEFHPLLRQVSEMPIPWRELFDRLRAEHQDVIGYPLALMWRDTEQSGWSDLRKAVAEAKGPHQARALYSHYFYADWDSDRGQNLAKAAALGHWRLTPEADRKAARVAAEQAAEAKRLVELAAWKIQVSGLVFALADGAAYTRESRWSQLAELLHGRLDPEANALRILASAIRVVGTPWSVGAGRPDFRVEARPPEWMAPATIRRWIERVFLDEDGDHLAWWPTAEGRLRLATLDAWVLPWLEQQASAAASAAAAAAGSSTSASVTSAAEPVPPAIAAQILRGRLLARCAAWGSDSMASAFDTWYADQHATLVAGGYAVLATDDADGPIGSYVAGDRDEDGAPKREEPFHDSRWPTMAMPLDRALELGRARAGAPAALEALGGAEAERWDPALPGHAEAMATLATAIGAGHRGAIAALMDRLGPDGNLGAIGAPDHLHHLRTSIPVTVGADALIEALGQQAGGEIIRLGKHPDPAMDVIARRITVDLGIACYLAATRSVPPTPDTGEAPEPPPWAAELADAWDLLNQAAGLDLPPRSQFPLRLAPRQEWADWPENAPQIIVWHRQRLAHVLAHLGDFDGAITQFTLANDLDGLAQVALVLPTDSPAAVAKRDALLDRVAADAAKLLPEDPDQRCRSATFYALAQRAEAIARTTPSAAAWATVADFYDQGTSLTFQLEWYNARCASRALELLAEGHLPMPPDKRMWWLRYYLDLPRTGTFVPPKADWAAVAVTAYDELAALPPTSDGQWARLTGLAMLHDAGPDDPIASTALARWRAADDPFALAILPRAELESTVAEAGKPVRAKAAAALALVLKQAHSDLTGDDALVDDEPTTKAKVTGWLDQAKAAGLRDEPVVRQQLQP